MQKIKELDKNILEFVQGDTKTTAEIHDRLPAKQKTISAALTRLVRRGFLMRPTHGKYVRPPKNSENPENSIENSKTLDAKNERAASDNIETINKILNLYDILLENLHVGFETESGRHVSISQKIDLIKSLRWLSATVDQLMKRWYLVHRGYDTNTRQAQEDAKAKARKVESEDIASLPPEERVVVVGEYDDVMKKLWDNLPESEQEKKTV